MGRVKRVRKEKMKRNQFMRGLKVLVAQAKKGKEHLEFMCLRNGHDFRNDVFERGDCVCIRCGTPNTACT